MVVINLMAIIWTAKFYDFPEGAIFIAILAAVTTGAIVQRLRFGRRTDTGARFDPVVTAGSILAFDAILIIVLFIRS